MTISGPGSKRPLHADAQPEAAETDRALSSATAAAPSKMRRCRSKDGSLHGPPESMDLRSSMDLVAPEDGSAIQALLPVPIQSSVGEAGGTLSSTDTVPCVFAGVSTDRSTGTHLHIVRMKTQQKH